MLKEGMNGFCMALADSVPGVSGGTVAFIMGFYDQFIGSIHNLAFGKMKEKKSAVMYLAKLGAGWVIGMAMAVVVLSALFESHIYAVSSLFIGFIGGAIPADCKRRKGQFTGYWKRDFFLPAWDPACCGNYLGEQQKRRSSYGTGAVFHRNIRQTVFYRNDCNFSHVSTGDIRLHIAFDFRRIYSGDYGSKRCSFSGIFVSSMSDIFRVRCTHRGGDSCEGD